MKPFGEVSNSRSSSWPPRCPAPILVRDFDNSIVEGAEESGPGGRLVRDTVPIAELIDCEVKTAGSNSPDEIMEGWLCLNVCIEYETGS
jgi:hypothetical protein